MRACYCIFSLCVSAQRLSIVSWCDQNTKVDRHVNRQLLEPHSSPGSWTGEQLYSNHTAVLCVVTSIRLEETRLSPLTVSLSPPSCPALQSSILFSPAQSCSVVHECQLSAASTLYLSLPLPLSFTSSLFLPHSLSPSLISLSVQRKNVCK